MEHNQTMYYGILYDVDDLLKVVPEFKNYFIKKIQKKIQKNEEKITYMMSKMKNEQIMYSIEKYNNETESYKKDIIDINNDTFDYDNCVNNISDGDFPLCINEMYIYVPDYGNCTEREQFIYGIEIDDGDEIDEFIEMTQKFKNITKEKPTFIIIESYG